MKKVLSVILMVIIATNLKAMKKIKIVERIINNCTITARKIEDDISGITEDLKIEVAEESIQEIYRDDYKKFGIMTYEYLINQHQVYKSETAIFAAGIIYSTNEAFGIKIANLLQMTEEGYEVIDYYKIDSQISAKDLGMMETNSYKITEKEYTKINQDMIEYLENKKSLIIKKIEKDARMKLEKIKDIMRKEVDNI